MKKLLLSFMPIALLGADKEPPKTPPLPRSPRTTSPIAIPTLECEEVELPSSPPTPPLMPHSPPRLPDSFAIRRERRQAFHHGSADLGPAIAAFKKAREKIERIDEEQKAKDTLYSS